MAEIARDVAERKRLEGDLLEARQNLEERVRQRTGERASAHQELLAGMAARAAAEEAIWEKESLLRSFFDSPGWMRGIVEVVDGDIRHLSDNPVAAAFFKQTVEAMRGRFASELGVPGDLLRLWLDHYEQSRHTGQPARFEYAHRSGDTEVWLQCHVCYLGSGPAQACRYAYVATDCTDRKRMENDLRESIQFRQQIIDSAQEGIIVHDLDLRYRLWNPFMERLTGIAANDVMGRYPLEVFPILGRTGLITNLQQVVAGEAGGQIEFPFEVPRTGRRGWASNVTAAVRNPKGQITGALVTVRDITRQKEDEEALAQSEQARREAEKLAATGRLAARIAHEINNPLAGIANAFQLFKDAIAKDRPEYRYMERADKEIQRVAQTVRLMYDLHRPRQEREAEVAIDETIREVAMMLEPLGRQRAVEVKTCSTMPVVRAYLPEGAIRQVLFALIANAIEASRPEEVVQVALAVEDEELLISVWDRGSGIPDELRDRIFEPFFSTKSGRGREGGLGLGLSGAKQIVEMLGGRLDYESEANQGSVFRVHLPMARIRGVVA